MAYAVQAGIWLALNNSPTTAAYASGGAPAATSVVISAANANIAYGQTITGTGFAANTTVTSVSGTTVNFTPAATGQISGTLTFATTWYKLTDHNRGPIEFSPTLIEKESRMADGTLRKYVVAKKYVISTAWTFLPALSENDSPIVDGNLGAAWITAFYNANVGVPVYVKIINAEMNDPTIGQIPNTSTYAKSSSTGENIYRCFISDFSKTLRFRNAISDYVNMSIEFTEI